MSKAEAPEKVLNWIDRVERQSGGLKVQTLGFDNAAEFHSEVLDIGLNMRGNGRVERAGRLIT
ncbi:unnamed protein product [Fusarium graminearum]|uniref:Chromosome 4, complete genome n=2 Tax=Gibberella zeae TaxID=5518 RepID=A0A0E0SCF1_GIBZE|nr:hypothetical protein FG05_35282 [Fusarium graminearum]CAF3448282.1 unnamed protein product [Fusarium graminearum]CAF3453397.1 unnamed protein product [Fusarium graminearum]CAG1991803.1 unnamed protein product [Fusarium graminearum]CAG2004170.1 unnamed protein product [Fusarium graminearum]